MRLLAILINFKVFSPLAPILAQIYLSNFENKNIFIDISTKEFV